MTLHEIHIDEVWKVYLELSSNNPKLNKLDEEDILEATSIYEDGYSIEESSFDQIAKVLVYLSENKKHHK